MTQLDLIPTPAPPKPFQIGTDRPIIFSGPMIRALLDGRKTQTRGLLKLAGRAPDYIGPRGCEDDPTCWGWEMPDGYFVTVEGDEKDHAPGWRNGWRDWAGAYAPGDRLWVRETFSRDGQSDGECLYRATVDDDTGYYAEEIAEIRWRPSIHMPRWASRLTLTVTDVRVQRVQEISLGDICAEGLARSIYDFAPVQRGFDAWAGLWNRMHRHDAWDTNPWVFALTFTVEHRNIDAAKEAEE